MKQTATATISFSSVATTFSNLNLNARSNTEIG